MIRRAADVPRRDVRRRTLVSSIKHARLLGEGRRRPSGCRHAPPAPAAAAVVDPVLEPIHQLHVASFPPQKFLHRRERRRGIANLAAAQDVHQVLRRRPVQTQLLHHVVDDLAHAQDPRRGDPPLRQPRRIRLRLVRREVKRSLGRIWHPVPLRDDVDDPLGERVLLLRGPHHLAHRHQHRAALALGLLAHERRGPRGQAPHPRVPARG
mmetsp:Transcript_1045/g.4261  ORF Transcript_1045/g.4261 Transcript_1045/m.4261 type:complete len:209 (+) Transcript_1045:39-665(+)